MNLIEATKRWPTPEAAMNHLEKVRWNGRVICPYCQSEKTCVHASKDKKMPRWQCETCHKAFSATVGTIFHHTHLPLSTWFLAITIMLNAKKNVSNAQLGRDLGLPYKTAWSLALRIREAMKTDPEQDRLFHGIIEMDETYVGGKPRKGNTGSGGASGSKRGRGTKKMAVVGMVERNGRAFAQVFEKRDIRYTGLKEFFERHADRDAAILMTDEFSAYRNFSKITRHYAVNHQKMYVSGDTHTNTIEGFWALVKRSWYGQHHHYSRKWADHYISEAAYKYNHRKTPDAFSGLVRHMAGVGA